MKTETSWKEGESGNPSGRPPSAVPSLPRSQLRNDLTRYRRLLDKALDVIKRSIEGEEMDRDQLSSAKFVVETIRQTQVAAVREEKDRVDMAVRVLEADIKKREHEGKIIEGKSVEDKSKEGQTSTSWNPPVVYRMEGADGEGDEEE